MTIYIAPIDATEEELAAALPPDMLALEFENVMTATEGALRTEGIVWVGIDPPPRECKTVNLAAPRAMPGDTPRSWLTFPNDQLCDNTTSLIAIRRK